MSEADTIRVLVPSRVDNLDFLQNVAEEASALAGFDEETRIDLGLAVREGAVNAIKHAHRHDPELEVEVSFHYDETKLEVRVRDQGDGFDPDEVSDPTAPENIWRSSGRGLLLIRSLVDEMQIVRKERGMEMLLVKHRRACDS